MCKEEAQLSSLFTELISARLLPAGAAFSCALYEWMSSVGRDTSGCPECEDSGLPSAVTPWLVRG